MRNSGLFIAERDLRMKASPFSQFKTPVLSYPMIFARSFCRSPNSSRRLRIASRMVVTFFGYAMSLGFFLFRRTRQKSNAASGTHCRREHELAQKKLTVVSSRLSAVLPKIKFDNILGVVRNFLDYVARRLNASSVELKSSW